MSTEAPALTEAQTQAFDQLMGAHYVPAFIKSCAEHGLEVNEDNLHQSLDMAAKLKVKMAQVEKQAGEGSQQLLLNTAEHNLNVALFGAEKAAELAGGTEVASKEATVPEASQKSIDMLMAQPAEAAAK